MSDPSFDRSSNRPAWVGGAILILIGLFFFVSNLTNFELENWWALFILIPAFYSFANAYQGYQQERRLSARSRGALLGGLALVFISAVFLFNLNFGPLWPVFLILGGVALLLNAMLPG